MAPGKAPMLYRPVFTHAHVGYNDFHSNLRRALRQVRRYRGKATRKKAVMVSTAVTRCDLYDGVRIVATGYAICTQAYDRKLGNKIALGRALKEAKNVR